MVLFLQLAGWKVYFECSLVEGSECEDVFLVLFGLIPILKTLESGANLEREACSLSSGWH